MPTFSQVFDSYANQTQMLQAARDVVIAGESTPYTGRYTGYTLGHGYDIRFQTGNQVIQDFDSAGIPLSTALRNSLTSIGSSAVGTNSTVNSQFTALYGANGLTSTQGSALLDVVLPRYRTMLTNTATANGITLSNNGLQAYLISQTYNGGTELFGPSQRQAILNDDPGQFLVDVLFANNKDDGSYSQGLQNRRMKDLAAALGVTITDKMVNGRYVVTGIKFAGNSYAAEALKDGFDDFSSRINSLIKGSGAGSKALRDLKGALLLDADMNLTPGASSDLNIYKNLLLAFLQNASTDEAFQGQDGIQIAYNGPLGDLFYSEDFNELLANEVGGGSLTSQLLGDLRDSNGKPIGQIAAGTATVTTPSGISVFVSDVVQAFTEKVQAVADFFERQADYLVDYYKSVDGQLSMQNATARIIVRLVQGENFNTVIAQEVTVLLAEPYIQEYLTSQLGVPQTELASRAQALLSQIILQTIVQGGDQFGVIAQNASVQAAVNAAIAHSGIDFLNNADGTLSSQGAGVAAAMMVFISAALGGDGINSTTVTQAGIAYGTTITATAMVSALTGGSSGGFALFTAAGGLPPIGFDPLTMIAAAVLTQIATNILLKPKIVHGETVSHRVEVQPDGSLKVIGLREAGALLRTTGNTNDDYIGTDSVDDSAGADVIVGQAGKNEIYARGGHDFIEGRANDDYIDAGTGNDHVEAGEGNDYVDGGAGNDRIYGGTGNDNLIGNTGNDLILGGYGDDRIEGNDGNDQLFGGAGKDTIVGGAGNDIIDGGADNDILSGEAGNDEIDGGFGDDEINGDDGDDILSGNAGNDQIRGGNGKDIIFGDDGVDVLYGDAGDDALDGGNENDLLFGGLGNDTLVGSYGDDVLYGEMGDDLLAGGKGNDQLHGGDGNDLYVFNAGDGQDIIDDQAGTNRLLLRGAFPSAVKLNRVGDDLLISWTGSTDTITVKNHFVTPGLSEIYFDGQSSYIPLSSATFDSNGIGTYSPWYGSGLPTIFAAQKSMYQQLTASFMASTAFSTGWLNNNFDTSVITDAYQLEYYNDVQVRSWSKKTWYGKQKIFFYDYYETVLKGSGYSDRIVGLFAGENINGDSANDQLYGNGGNDTINGGIDHDIIFGGEGNDALNGEAGNDKIFGGFGVDTITGGAGNDTLYGEQGADNISGGDDDDYLSGGDDNDTLNGDAGNDLLYGEQGDDILNGGTGSDYLNGGVGNDTLNGGSGNDILFGEDGNDILNGDDGDDIILGGKGTNTINGGNGIDMLVLSGDPKDYNIVFNTDGTIQQISDLRPDAPDGINNLTSIEKIRFADKEITVADIFKPVSNNIIATQGSQLWNSDGFPADYLVAVTQQPAFGNVFVVYGSNGSGLSYSAPDTFIGSTTFTYRVTSPDGFVMNYTGNINVVGATDSTSQPTLAATQIDVAKYVHQNAGLGTEELISSRIAKLSSGAYVLVWSSHGDDGSGYGVYGRLFDKNGTPTGNKFLINASTSGNQFSADVVALQGSGDMYYVTYTTTNSGGDTDVKLSFLAGSSPMLETTISQTVTNNQTAPKAEMLKDGSVIVVWQSNQTGAGTSGYDIYARRFRNSSGSTRGDDLKINTTVVTGDQVNPQIAALSDGGYVVVWEDQGGADGSGRGVYAQRVTISGSTGTGTLSGSASLVNTTTAGDQKEAAVAALRDGGFVVTWTAAGQDGSGTGIYAQRYNSSFAKVGSEFKVNTTTTGDQSTSDVIALMGGGFFVVWQSPDASGTGIYGQRFNASGTAVGTEFRINNETNGNQYYPSLTELANGDLMVNWQSFNDPLTPKVMSRRVVMGISGVTMTGTSGDDIIMGGENAETINAGDGNDTIYAGFAATSTSNVIDGGNGIDTALFNKYSQAYNISINAAFDGKVQVSEKSPTGVGIEASILSNVEKLKFTDQTIDIASYLPSLPTVTLAANASYQGQITLPPGFTLSSVQAPTSGSVSFSGNTFTVNAGNTEGTFTYRYSITNSNGFTKYVQSSFVVPHEATSLPGPVSYNAQSEVFTTYAYSSDDSVTAPKLAKRTGGFVAVWTSNGSDGSNDGIVGQLFDANNNKVGSTFNVNTTTANAQAVPEVVGLASGGFAVVWSSSAAGGTTDNDIKLQRFDASGTKVGSEITINGTTTGNQTFAGITEMSNGDLIVTWSGQGSSGDTDEIWMRRFNSSGTALTSETKVNDTVTTTGIQRKSSVVALTGGNYVVVWQDENGADGSQNGVYGKVFNSSNTAVGSVFRLNTYTSDKQQDVSIAALTGGGFVATWSSFLQDGSHYGVYGQRFDATGAKVGSEFQVATTTTMEQELPSVTGLSTGGYVVTWKGRGTSSTGYSQRYDYAQVFNADGTKFGSEFAIYQYDQTNLERPDVLELASGDIVFAYKSYNTSGNAQVITRRFAKVSNDLETYVYTGDASNNIFVGSSGSDTISGGDGDDILVGENGADFINGGNGIDTSVYHGNRSSYTITIRDNDVVVRDNRPGVPLADDVLTSIEKLKFDDITVNLVDLLPALGKLKTSMGKSYTYDTPAGVTLSIVTGPTIGTLSIVNGKLVYTAPASAIGSTQFTYQMVDGNGTIRRSTTSVDVFPVSAGSLGYTAGSETVIATITGGLGEDISSMVRLKDGSYVVTYASGNNDNSRIYGARFTAAGAMIGSSFVVSPVGFTQDQLGAGVVALNDGGFAIYYSGFNGGGNYNRSEVYLQRYSSTGTAVGSLIQVNPNTNGDQSYVNATVLDDGKLVVAYNSVYASQWGIRWYEAWSSDIAVRTYDASGTLIGTETIIASSSVEHPRLPSLSNLGNGRYVVLWQTGGQPPDSAYSIRGQIMTAAGTKVGAEFTLESQPMTTNVYNYVTEVVGLKNGGFVATWHGIDSNSMGVFARWYDAYGTAVSAKVTVNAYFNNVQFAPKIIAMNDGGAFITWSSYGEDGSGWTVKGQRYDRFGNSVGQNITINSTTTGDQYGISLVELNNGDIVFQWEDRSTSTPRIVQRRFTALGEGGYELTGDAGDDVLIGGSANDVISGGAGNDVLVGGAGNDILMGGAGNDTYRIDAAQGADVIDNQDSDGFDRLMLGTGIDRHELWFSQKGYDLRIDQLGTLDSITVRNWYLNDGQKLDEIKLSDGSVLAKNKVDQLVSAMAGFNPQAIGSVTGLGDLPQSVQTTIAASWQ